MRVLRLALPALILLSLPWPACGQNELGTGTPVRLTMSADGTFVELARLLVPDVPSTHIASRGQLIVVRVEGQPPVYIPRPAVRLTGIVIRVTDQTVRMTTDREQLEAIVPRAAIGRLEVQAGVGSRWGHVGWGALIGAGVGALIGAASVIGCEPHGILDCWALGAASGGAILGSLGGAAVGGAIPPPRRWVSIRF